MRLVDADALRQRIESDFYWNRGGVTSCLEAIDDAPTIEAAPVVHGRWEKCWQEKSRHYFRCSNCKTAYMDGVSGAIAPEYGSRAWRYCPNCGVKMDGGAEDVNRI